MSLKLSLGLLYNTCNCFSVAHPKSQRKLQNLIEKYFNAYVEASSYENKLYYHSGFCDGISIIKKALTEH